MGMCLSLHSVSDRNIDKILASPPLIWRLIAADDAEIYLAGINESKAGFFSRLFGKKKTEPADPIPVLDFVDGENIEDDLDKSWQGIHYCLNKTAYEADPPMDFLTLGGKVAGNVDVGYGPARLFDSKTVRQIEEKLATLTWVDLRNNYDPNDMEKLDIYPKIWNRDGDEGFDYIAAYFETLRSFISKCTAPQMGMAVYLC